MLEQATTPLYIGFDLKLNNIKSSQKTFSKILQGFSNGTIEEKTYKSLIWGMSLFLPYMKLNAEQDILDRLKEIEKSMEKK